MAQIAEKQELNHEWTQINTDLEAAKKAIYWSAIRSPLHGEIKARLRPAERREQGPCSLACLQIRLLSSAMLEIDGSLCVFCGSRANSKEHVFAKSVCECAGDINYPVTAGLSVEGKENLIRNPKPMPIQALTVRCVCKPCNNLWMSKLETWFISRLGSLIDPQWPQDALTVIERLKPERNTLAHWLIKTAVTYSHTTLECNHPVEFSSAVTHKIKDGILPQNCWIDLAYSRTKTFGAGITRHFYVKNGVRPIQNFPLNDGDGFHFVVQLNHLLLRIAQAPEADVICKSQRGEIPVRLYPMPCPQTPENFEYNDMMEFQSSVFLETWAEYRGSKA